MKKSKRILALLMCILMCVSLLPVSAFADEDSAAFSDAEEVETVQAEETPAAEEVTEEPAAEEPAEETPAVPAEEAADEGLIVAADEEPLPQAVLTDENSNSCIQTFAVESTPDKPYPESAHNYDNSCDDVQTYTYEGAIRIAVTFSSSTEVESGYDKIYVNGTSYTGTALAGQTLTFDGDTVTIELTSDGSVNNYGYSIDSIVVTTGAHTYDDGVYTDPAIDVDGYTTYTCTVCGDSYMVTDEGTALPNPCIQTYVADSADYPESAHNYANSCDLTWVKTYQNATQIVVVFSSSTEVESNFDYIYVNGTGYTGTELAGQTLTLDSDTVTIRLTSDSSQTCYGFSIDSITVTGPVHTPAGEGVYTAADYGADAYRTYTCTVCGETYVETYPGTQLHAYENHRCTYCGEMEDGWVDSGTCGDNLIWSLSDASVLTVSGTGEMTSIGWGNYYDQIKTVVIEEGVTSIADYAFRSKWYLTEVSLPKGLLTIGTGAFQYCSNLDAITIPASVTSIGECAFAEVQSFALDPANATYAMEDGVLFNKDQTVLIAVPYGKTGAYTVPAGVTEIADYAFSYAQVNSVTLPEGLETIGENAFNDCYNLKAVRISSGIRTIGDYAFAYTGSLATVVFEGDAPSISSSAFQCWSGADTVTVYYPADNTTWDGIPDGSYGRTLNWVNDTITTVDETTFPDAAFRAAVQEKLGVSGSAKASDFAMVTELDISGLGISDLTGIECFTSLYTLNCSYNKLTKLPDSVSSINNISAYGQTVDAVLTLYQAEDGVYLADVSEAFPDGHDGLSLNRYSNYYFSASWLSDNLVLLKGTNLQYNSTLSFYRDADNYYLSGTLSYEVTPLEVSAASATILMAPSTSESIEISSNMPALAQQALSYNVTGHVYNPIDETYTDADETTPVITLDSDQMLVTAVNPGTATVSLTLTYTVESEQYDSDTGDYYTVTSEYTLPLTDEFLRVDVVEDAGLVKGVDLISTKATINLAATAEPEITILPLLDQLELLDEESDAELVQSARFVNTKTAALFDLEVVDSRTLRIVPNDTALAAGKAGTYKSQIEVTIGGQAFTSSQTLTLTVKNTAPTIKAAAVKLNTYLSNPTATLSFTGADVTGFEIVSKPAWLNVDPETMTVSLTEDAPVKATGKLVVKCLSSNYRNLSGKVTVSITVARTAPKIKLSTSKLTLSADYASQGTAQFRITSSEFYNSAVQVERITEKVGKKTVACDSSLFDTYISRGNNGWVYISVVYYPLDNASHSYTLYFSVAGKEFSVPVSVVALSKASFTPKLSGSLDNSVSGSVAALSVTAKSYYGHNTYSYYGNSSYTTAIESIVGTKKGSTTLTYNSSSVEGCPFVWEEDGTTITLKDDAVIPAGYTWTAKVRVYYGRTSDYQTYSMNKLYSLKLTVKDPSKPTKVNALVKASGKVDFYGMTTATFTVYLKDVSAAVYPTGWTITRVYNGVTKAKDNTDVSDLFGVYNYGGTGTGKSTYYVYVRYTNYWYGEDDEIILHSSDKFKFTPIYDESLGIKVTPLTFTLSKSKLSVSTSKSVTMLKNDRFYSVTLPLNVTSGHGIEAVTLDSKSAAYYDVTLNSDNTVTLSWANYGLNRAKAPTTISLKVFVDGNNSLWDDAQKATADKTLSVTVKIK